MQVELRDRMQAALGGEYTLREELGGTMSRVFLARERARERDVVMKMLPPELAVDVNAERFAREVQVNSRLRHPCIVPLLAAGEAEGIPYYTMPAVRGESLRARLEREGRLPVVDAIRILRSVADALDHAHRQGIAHRDIKPENILLPLREHAAPAPVRVDAMVADFGVAKALSTTAPWEYALVANRIAVGTPAYMAPEQATADPNADHRADLYSLGAVAYECITGHPPFIGRSPRAVMEAHTITPPHPVTRADLPPGFSELVMRCLEKRPEDRPRSARELVEQLDRCLRSALGALAPADGRRARAGRFALFAALLVGTIAFFLYVLAPRLGG